MWCWFQVHSKVIQLYIHILQILSPYRLLQDTEQSPLRYTVGPCWLPVLYIIECICKSLSPNWSSPLSPLVTRNLFLCPWVSFCFGNKFLFVFFCCCCCSIAQLCPTLCDPVDCSTPGFLILHYLPEPAQIRVHWVSDAIQPSHPRSPPSPPPFNLSQHQGLFQWVSSVHQVAKVLELQGQHKSFQWIFRVDFLNLFSFGFHIQVISFPSGSEF